MNEYYVNQLIKLANKAAKKDEVPVSALITKDNKIIAKAYNKRLKSNNPLMHAEIQCIIKAGKKLKDWRLDDCTMYVSMEPCHMCKEIIGECRIKKIYFLLKNDKKVNYKQTYYKINCKKSDDYEKLIKTFFRNIRK